MQAALARRSFAVRETVSECRAQTTGAACVRQNRVVLAPEGCAPSRVVMQAVHPGARISHLHGDGALVHRPRGEHDISRQPTAQGTAGISRQPCTPLCRLFWHITHSGSAGASRLPAFPAPSALSRAHHRKARAQRAARWRRRVRDCKYKTTKTPTRACLRGACWKHPLRCGAWTQATPEVVTQNRSNKM